MTPLSRVSRRQPESWSDERLVEECLRGNEEAWSALIDRYKNLVYSVPIRYGFTREDAGEIFQQVCLGLLTDLHQLRDAKSLASWLITSTSRACFQWVRRERRYHPIDEQKGAEQAAVASQMPDALLREVEQEQILREAIQSMPERCRKLIQILFFETPPLSYDEAAQRLSLARGSIGFIRMRCLRRLRKSLQERGFP